MPTGACGINCDVCRLNLLGVCTTCGAGKSKEARSKLSTQKRILGSTCAVLSCCVMNNKDHCIRDCSQFPCENYELNPYPFSETYLAMQKRRRQHPVLQLDPLGKEVIVPDDLWDDVFARDMNLVGTYSLARYIGKGQLSFDFLNHSMVLDLTNRIMYEKQAGQEVAIDNPLLELISLTYFKKVDRFYPIGKQLISSKDMKQSVYFSGMNRLNKEPVLRRFKDDYPEFVRTAQALGGRAVDLADAAVVVYPFTQVPVYYLLWREEEGYPARISILFDHSIERVFSPPVIWSLVNLLNSYLISQ